MKACCLQRPSGTPSRAHQAHPSLFLARRRRWDTGISWKLLLQMPLRCFPVSEAFPWSRVRHGSTHPQSVPSPTSAVPTHHRRLHTASPHAGPSGAAQQALGTELPSDPTLPSMLPAARPPALPAGLHTLPPQQVTPGKDGALVPWGQAAQRGTEGSGSPMNLTAASRKLA